MTEPTEAPAAGGTRGRPRPDETIERDAKVLAFIANHADGVTRKQIVEGTSIPGNEVYLSLYRLRRDGKAARTGSTWKALAPESAE